MLINKSGVTQIVSLQVPDAGLKPETIFPDRKYAVKNRKIEIGPEMTIVVKWS